MKIINLYSLMPGLWVGLIHQTDWEEGIFSPMFPDPAVSVLGEK